MTVFDMSPDADYKGPYISNCEIMSPLGLPKNVCLFEFVGNKSNAYVVAHLDRLLICPVDMFSERAKRVAYRKMLWRNGKSSVWQVLLAYVT